MILRSKLVGAILNVLI